MSSHTLADPKIELIHHVDAIRDYGRRMVLEGETLSSVETADLEARMRNFLAIGENYGLTQKEMVGLVLGQSSSKKAECGCHSCNVRKQS